MRSVNIGTSRRTLIDEAVSALQARMGDPVCPMCRHRAWTAEVAGLTLTRLGGPLSGVETRRSTEALILVCKQCGYESIHSLRVLGIHAREPEAAAPARPGSWAGHETKIHHTDRLQAVPPEAASEPRRSLLS